MKTMKKRDMDYIMRRTLRDCLSLIEDAGISVSDVAAIVGVTRATVYKWQQHPAGDWKTLPVSGSTAATTFMNLLILRRILTQGLENGSLPAGNKTRTAHWLKSIVPDAR